MSQNPSPATAHAESRVSGSSRPGNLEPWPEYTEDEIDAVDEVLRSGKVNFWTGSRCRQFEAEFASAFGGNFAVSLANGTVALDLALEAAGVSAGDEVIVTPRSFIASASCVVRAGARPVFADVSLDSQNITVDSVRAVLTQRTRAIIAVHHAGWPCDMVGLSKLADEHGLVLIEDCAQAHGATIGGRSVGGFGHFAAFSFCQDKIISTGGEGGMLLCRDPGQWEKAFAIKDHGKSYEAVFNRIHPPGFRWVHESVGGNYRMTEMQAAIGLVQLEKLPRWSQARRRNAHRISAALRQFPFVNVAEPPSDVGHAYYRLYATVDPALADNGNLRDAILGRLVESGFPALSGSCPEIYREKAFSDRGMGPDSPLANAVQLGNTSMAFLVHHTISDASLSEYCDAIESALLAHRPG